MQTRAPFFPLAMTLFLSACALPEDTWPDAEDDPSAETTAPTSTTSSSSSSTPSSRERSSRPTEGPFVLTGGPAGATVAGWTEEGDVALFDPGTGALITTAAGGELGGGRDLAVDPWLSRLIVFQSDAEDPWGEVASYPLSAGGAGPSLGARKHEVWVDGVARVLASPFGAVVMEDGNGPRWRLVRADGQPSASVYGPRPMSVATEIVPGGALRITALTYGPEGDEAELRVALVEADGMGETVSVPLSVEPPSEPLGARWVKSAEGGQIVDVAAGDVVVSTYAGGGWPPLMPAGVGPGIDRVEHVAAFPGGARLAMLTSGEVNLVVAGIGPGGAPECAAALDLPGEPEEAALFFARGLAVVGAARVLAATTSGVFAVTVSGECPPVLAIDPAFEGGGLRGPLELVP